MKKQILALLYIVAINGTAIADNTLTKQAIEPEMVAITGGCFQMGSPETEPEREKDEKQHQVCVENFEIGKYEVTQAQWQAVMGNNPSYFKECGDNCPVENVSWSDVQKFLQKLNAKTGKNYRLPTEAEWEYAARAGTTTRYYWGDDNNIDCSKANYGAGYNHCSIGKTKSVGFYPANPWGVYDMVGNVSEWTCSAYIENYDGNEIRCFINPRVKRSVRGGSWGNDDKRVRSAFRNDLYLPGDRVGDLGFRLVLGL